MSCPTCDHTMQKLSAEEPTYWCPRCGTLKTIQCHLEDGFVNLDTPKLVTRTRDLLKTFAKGSAAANNAWHLGVVESCLDCTNREAPHESG